MIGRRHALVLAIAVSGCALTSRSEPVTWQYFTPERVQPVLQSAEVSGEHAELCVGRVIAGGSSGKRIARSDGGYRLDYYPDRRWTDEPDRYVRRAIERTLFQQTGFRCDLGTNAARLDVEVLKFEEMTTKATHAARVALRVVVTTDHVVSDETIDSVEIVSGSSFDDVVAAVGRALDRAALDVAHRARLALSKEPPTR